MVITGSLVVTYIFQVQPTFSAKEMTRRQEMLRRHMETAGLDACVFTSYHNVYYFSDFLYCKFGRNSAYIVTPEKAISVSGCKYLYKVILKNTSLLIIFS
jgi:Xaa-Pro aminopeptidase